MKILFGVLFVVALFFGAESAKRTCAHNEYVEHMVSKDPSLRQRWAAAEDELHYMARENKKRADDVYTIPVVVHVIYSNTDQNISDGRIVDQIARLNIDYRKLNDQASTVNTFKPLASDAKIQFILATTDPSSNPTSGITRTPTAVTTFPSPGTAGFDNNCQKSSTGGKDAWDSTRYMNIWVCNLGGDKLGFAQLPQGPASTDGIVINTQAFGYSSFAPYNLGRTLTHESGHWFNLKHPWGDDTGDCTEDDDVPDTPITDNESYQCNLTRVSCGVQTMVQNYMDYSDDNCMTLFTPLQVERMRFVLGPTGFRKNVAIVNYSGPAPIGTSGNYTSPYGPLGGSPEPAQTNDEPSSSGLSIDDFKSGTYLYILIAVAACIGLALICAIAGAIRGRRR